MRFSSAVSELRRLSSSYWTVVAIAVVFTLARFSEAFLILRAQSEDWPWRSCRLCSSLMNVFYALSVLSCGVLSDNGSRRTFWRSVCSCSLRLISSWR